MFPVLAGSNPSGYNLTRSLRFRASASAYLNRTLTTPTNQAIWTWSAWVKRGVLSSAGFLLSAGSAGTTDANIYLETDNTLVINKRSSYNLTTTQVFRDPSAWYHIVIAYDSTQSTSTNRLKLYVNGSQVSAFGTASYPSLNETSSINSATATFIGRRSDGNYFDGYLAEVNFIDGQALTPSSFGSTNALTGVWQPARYTGTYGTNGFYLPFTDNSALTTSSNVGLGKDFSGNGNYWITNNISITAGVTYDSMTDVPTLTSATAANFAVLNPVSFYYQSTTIANGNLQMTGNFVSNHSTSPSTIAVSSGKWYAEFTLTVIGGNYAQVGILSTDSNLNTINPYIGGYAKGYAYWKDGSKANNTVNAAYGAAYTTNDVIGVAFDADAGTLVFYKNNTSQGTAYSGISGTFYFAVDAYNSGAWAANFGQQPFTYTPPTGFVALNTYNLPTSTILQGNKVMDATLYTGTLLSNAITNSASFKPDLVWLKSRSAATDNELTDSVRGVTKSITSNSTAAEATDVQGLTAFNTNGFTVGTNTNYNNLAATYVAWQWQAGQGSTSSNTSGTITSTVSVNASAGFSVVTYTGDRSTTPQTVGHGLGVAPALIIFKARNNAINWLVYHQSVGNTKALYLNLSDAAFTTSGFFNNTSPTSSVFTINTANENNGNLYTMVAYCWTPIAGYSSFGSYTGNSSTNGPFIYCGFRPKFVMIKRSNAASDWFMDDSVRDPYNSVTHNIVANTAAAETTFTANNGFDYLSNGFKLRDTTAGINSNTDTYVYAAFAENPFKNSLAR